MFDREIIKKELQQTTKEIDVDLDAVIDNYTMLDGFYCFRVGVNAHIFNNNEFIDSFPGFFSREED